MLQKVLSYIKRVFISEAYNLSSKQIIQNAPSIVIPHREMVRDLLNIPHWQDKISFVGKFEYNCSFGGWVCQNKDLNICTLQPFAGLHDVKVHYGCGENIISGWVNIDLYDSEVESYKKINLLEKHPFENNSIRFGFSEDMLEHLSQAESIFFLSEVYRTLAPNGVIRLSFPGLEGVLNKHYTPVTEKRVREGELEAYSFWDHVHFYSREELETVARHLGFKTVTFLEYGKSKYHELSNMETREHQIGLSTHAELTK